MELLITEEITAKLIVSSINLPPKSELIQNGTATGVVIQGAILECAIKYGECFLLFLTNDIPDEDTLSIFLLDSQLRTLDRASLGGMYSTGSFTNVKLIPPSSVKFNFIGGCDWRIDILPTAEFHIPFLSCVRGVKRPFSFSRHFVVLGSPLSEKV